MKHLTARKNPALRDLRALAGDARRQRKERRTLIEGPHLVATCLEHGHPLDLLVTSESALARTEVATLLQRAAGIEILCLRDTLFRELSHLATPLGILARITIPAETQLAPMSDCLLLDAVQDAGNVGALLRTAAAAGVRDVLLGTGCAGAWTPRVLRAAQGAHFGLRIYEQIDLAAFLGNHNGLAIAAVAHGGVAPQSLDLSAPITWLFGSEGAGLAPELATLSQHQATIPLAAGFESLNVATAAAVCLFEMRRQRDASCTM